MKEIRMSLYNMRGELVMSDQKWSLVKSLVVSVTIIATSLILASAVKDGAHYIGDAIGSGLRGIGNSFSVTTTGETADGITTFRDYLTEYDASAFLLINIDDFDTFIQSGELDGTFTMIQGNRVFSKEKLTQ